MTEIGVVVKVLLSTKEESDLTAFLNDNKYPAGEAGLKEIILEIIYEDPEEGKQESRFAQTLKDNPEIVHIGAQLIQGASAIVNRKLFGDKKN
jgi:hypothetical protein